MASAPQLCSLGQGGREGKARAPHLFSVEQKNCTHGLVLPLSGAGGRYMASEKHVSSSFSSSVLGGGDSVPEDPNSPLGGRAHRAQPQLESMKKMAPFYPCEAEAGS